MLEGTGVQETYMEVHIVIPPFVVVKSSFNGMAWLQNFISIQRPGVPQQNKYGKKTTVTSTFWDFLEAECSNTSIDKYLKMKILKLHHFFFCLLQTKQTFISLKQSGNCTHIFFLQSRIISFNSSILLTNHRPPYIKQLSRVVRTIGLCAPY